MRSKTPLSQRTDEEPDDPDMEYPDNTSEPVVHSNTIQHQVVLNPTPAILSSRSDLSAQNIETVAATKELVDSYQLKIQNYLGKETK